MAKKTRTKVVKELDRVFSLYIRQRHANLDGFVECVTCGAVKHWKDMDAGHFQSRRKYSTRWDEQNVFPQDKRCNIFNQGEQFIFGKRLDEMFGNGTADKIIQRSNQTIKFSTQELEEKIEYYKLKINQL